MAITCCKTHHSHCVLQDTPQPLHAAGHQARSRVVRYNAAGFVASPKVDLPNRDAGYVACEDSEASIMPKIRHVAQMQVVTPCNNYQQWQLASRPCGPRYCRSVRENSAAEGLTAGHEDSESAGDLDDSGKLNHSAPPLPDTLPQANVAGDIIVIEDDSNSPCHSTYPSHDIIVIDDSSSEED
ncbi:hypothetical protein BC827DRAFT_1158698 [Russula dissimulans]|nr:hypothetical protein BC827DRAFT_1158698 [Russula dissimulans]